MHKTVSQRSKLAKESNNRRDPKHIARVHKAHLSILPPERAASKLLNDFLDIVYNFEELSNSIKSQPKLKKSSLNFISSVSA